MDESIRNDIQNEPWLKSYWRPGMAWLYMAICAFDFILFPVFAMVIPGFIETTYIPWKSITLENGGLIHLAFGAILGVTAWTRGTEKQVRYTADYNYNRYDENTDSYEDLADYRYNKNRNRE
jgi:hypothetical protein